MNEQHDTPPKKFECPDCGEACSMFNPPDAPKSGTPPTGQCCKDCGESSCICKRQSASSGTQGSREQLIEVSEFLDKHFTALASEQTSFTRSDMILFAHSFASSRNAELEKERDELKQYKRIYLKTRSLESLKNDTLRRDLRAAESRLARYDGLIQKLAALDDRYLTNEETRELKAEARSLKEKL